MSFELYFITEDAFDTAVRRWVAAGYDAQLAQQAVDMLKQAKKQHIILGNDADIHRWQKQSPEELIQFINNLNDGKMQRDSFETEASKATTVFKNDRVTVIVPQTWQAAQKYGKNTKWCVASNTQGQQHFEQYTVNDNCVIYYCLVKGAPNKSFAFVIYPQDEENESFSVFDSTDEEIPISIHDTGTGRSAMNRFAETGDKNDVVQSSIFNLLTYYRIPGRIFVDHLGNSVKGITNIRGYDRRTSRSDYNRINRKFTTDKRYHEDAQALEAFKASPLAGVFKYFNSVKNERGVPEVSIKYRYFSELYRDLHLRIDGTNTLEKAVTASTIVAEYALQNSANVRMIGMKITEPSEMLAKYTTKEGIAAKAMFVNVKNGKADAHLSADSTDINRIDIVDAPEEFHKIGIKKMKLDISSV